MENESKIIDDCQQGETDKFALLYDFYLKKIYEFVYYRVQHRETAEDLTSKVFVKALEHVSKYRSEAGSFKSWLYCIARNTVIDHYRTSKKEADIDNVFNLAKDEDIIRDVDAKMKLEKIRKYLEKLRPQERDIVVMRIWDQLSYKEISGVLNKSEASVKMMFSRIIHKLREKELFVLSLITISISIF